MTSLDLEELTISRVSSQIRQKKISPIELIGLFLERTKGLNPVLNAYVTLTEERALADAGTAEKEIRRGRYRGPLHGVPFSIKDNLATQGIRTTAGSKILSDWVPDHDATVVERLKRAGAIILGKTNMHEWASGSTTINPYYGTTRNPWDTERVAGGSSGGSASAVMASLCLGSIGTDNAGSVRNPASFCGAVGLKPTYGRVSRFGDVPGTGGFSTDHFGVLTKTVRDCALVLQFIAGADPKDPLSSDEPVPNYLKGIGKKLTSLKVGLLKGYFEENVSGEVRRVFEDAVTLLHSLGMKAKEVGIPYGELIAAVQTATTRVENVSNLVNYLKTRPRDFSSSLLYRYICSLTIPASTYVTAQRVRRLICQEFDKIFAEVDILVTPTTPTTAPTIEQCKQQGFADLGIACTIPFNVTGLPAINVCCGFSSNGSPVGLQIVGRAFQETLVFQVAHAYEKTARWFERRPQLTLS